MKSVLLLNKPRAVARRAARPFLATVERQRWAKYYTAPHQDYDLDLHIREAAEWLCRAQDAGTDRGISYGTRFGQAFDVSYPETTGYIICTFLALADHYADPAYFERAIAAGDWEIAVQMPCGAVMAGKFNDHPSPAVFNTGQVLLGWADLYRRTREPRYREAGRRAAAWMVSTQEPDGQWLRGHSIEAEPSITVYNVKAAWGLAEMGRILSWEEPVRAAVRSAEYALTRQLPNGWFADCCLTDAERPLLHTIAYTMQGLVGIGKLTGRQDFLEAAARTARALAALMDAGGFLPGRITRDFRAAVNWCCLTGNAQTSIVWRQLDEIRGRREFAEAARLANRYLMAHHDIANPDPAVRGGLAGSWPVWEEYGPFQVLNWAAKFLTDALLLERRRPA